MAASIKERLVPVVNLVLCLVDELILSGPLRPDKDKRWPELREAHARANQLLDEFIADKPPEAKKFELPGPWEELDLEQLQWGIFQSEGLTPSPMGLFPTKEAAEKYLEYMTRIVDEDHRWGTEDWCIMPCVAHGITFNDYRDENVEFREAERIFWNWVESQ